MPVKSMIKNGKRYVLVPEAEYQRLSEPPLPSLPVSRADGTTNAIEFMRASIARSLIQDRRSAGLSQQQLAKLAGVRQETISRIESSKHTATVEVIRKLDAAIRKASKGTRGRATSATTARVGIEKAA
jgi:DNA-binding XRE family transcriptional regulator